jgi:hypothetical protein
MEITPQSSKGVKKMDNWGGKPKVIKLKEGINNKSAEELEYIYYVMQGDKKPSELSDI